MTHFELLTSQSLTEQVVAQLRGAIAAGRLRPGDRLVEADLGRQMGISRAPVREALRQLEFEGLTQRVPRRGYFVRGLSADGIDEIYDLRVLLEPLLARHAAPRMNEADRARLRAIVDRMREAGKRDDWAEIVNADREFHALVGRLSGRELTAQTFAHLNEQVRSFMSLLWPHYDRPEQMADEHEALLAAVVSGDGKRAEREMRRHIEDARRQLAAILGDGKPGMEGETAVIDGDCQGIAPDGPVR